MVTLLARRADAKVLMWVRVKDDEKCNQATKALAEHSGRDVHPQDWSE